MNDEHIATPEKPALPLPPVNNPIKIGPPGDLFPEKNGSEPEENDGAEQEEPPLENSTFEKIKSATNNLFEKSGFIFKRGRGRPRSDGTPKISDIPVDMPPGTVPAVVANGAPPSDGGRNANLTKRLAKAMYKSIILCADKIIFTKAVQVTGDREYARAIVSECTATDGESESFSEAFGILCEMYNYDPKVVALTVSLVTVGLSGGRYVLTFQGLSQMSKKSATFKSPLTDQTKP